MIGLASKTEGVIEAVSKLECIKEYVLVGGTAISLQINHRLSEDLDFCKWVNTDKVNDGIKVKTIEAELKANFTTVFTNYLNFSQVDFIINDVKLTFFHEVGYKVPEFERKTLLGNIVLAPLSLLGCMKVKTMFQRNTLRDYYDIFVLLNNGYLTIEELIITSLAYDKKLRRQMIINRLIRWQEIPVEAGFQLLSPKYSISNKEMGEKIMTLF